MGHESGSTRDIISDIVDPRQGLRPVSEYDVPSPYFTKEMLAKMEQVASLDGTYEEMAFHCGVSRATIHNWLRSSPVLKERIEGLRAFPVLKARRSLINALDDPHYAVEYLKRKRKGEFSDRIEQTGADGAPLSIQLSKEIAEKNDINVTDTSAVDDSSGPAPV